MLALFGRYQFERELGRGATGRVFAARDLADHGAGRAIKVVPSAYGPRLAWEFERLCRVEHEGVARVRELLRVEGPVHAPYGLAAGSWLLVEDLAEGMPLSGVDASVDQGARVQFALRVALGAAEALAAVHHVGLVHGDVKPDNLLVDELGSKHALGGASEALRVTLVDLGFAGAPGLGETPRGTPRFMAPELFSGVRSPAADVYALGAVLFDWLLGARGDEASGRGLEGLVRRDTGLLEGSVPAALRALMAQLLDPDPALRPADGEAVVFALRPVAHQLGVSMKDTLAVLHGVPSAETRASRARTMPFVGRAALVEELALSLRTPGLTLVRASHGAGSSRTVREAIRRVQLSAAELGQVPPTVVRSLDVLASVRDVPALVWLDRDDDALEQTIKAASRTALIADTRTSVIIECGPEVTCDDARVVDVGPLGAVELRQLLAALVAPSRPSPALVEAATEASQAMAGRLCELTAELFAEGRDVSDPRSFAALSTGTSRHALSAQALSLAGLFAWWGQGLMPGDASALEVDARGLESAFRELSAKALLVVRGDQLELEKAFAREARRLSFAHRRELIAELAVRKTPYTGFALFALGRVDDAQPAFERDASSLMREGDMTAARALLEEACSLAATSSLRVLWADTERALASYQAAEVALAEDCSPEATLLRAEVLRLRGQRASARAALSYPFQGAHRERAHALSARLSFDEGAFDRARGELAELDPATDAEARVRALEVEILLDLMHGLPSLVRADVLVGEANTLGSVRRVARALSLRAQLLARLGDRAAALRDAHAALEHARRAGEAHETATYALNLGLLQCEAGELHRALETLREAAYRLSRIDRPADLVRVMCNVGIVSQVVGDDARAAAVFDLAERLRERVEDPSAAALLCVGRSELLLRAGQLDAASALLESALLEVPGNLAPIRAVLLARAGHVRLLLSDSDSARAHLTLARSLVGSDDLGVALEVHTLEVRYALAQGDVALAARAAERGTPAARGNAPFAERVRFLLAAIDAARADRNEGLVRERTLLCRALLEAALAGLLPAQRARMRGRPEYARVLSAEGGAVREGEAGEGRFRALVRASRRLFAARARTRIAEQVVQIALELVHAERALLIACTEEGLLEVRTHAELSPDAPRVASFSRSVVERVWGERKPLVTVDAAEDLRLHSAQSIHALHVRSVLAVPVDGFGEPTVLYLDDRLRSDAFGADDLALIEDLASLSREALRVGQARREDARRARRAEHEANALTRELALASANQVKSPLVGVSRALIEVTHNARRVAHSDASLLITGASGTGKELLARMVHDESPRRAQAFVAESCAALPDALLESALFGHVRGAFTGADRARRGLFEIADRGTLFLDEVGEMSPALQAKLLRVLQEGEFRPLGSERAKRVDVRVIAATRRDLAARARTGEFREDLYYRLAVVTLELPALASRREDIPLLVRHFVEKHQPAGKTVRVSAAALRAFVQREYPGNVRQLENEVRRALAFCNDDCIEPADLPPAPAQEASPSLDQGLHAQLEQLTARLVDDALTSSQGNVTHAAQLLGISRFGLQKILKRTGRGAQRK